MSGNIPAPAPPPDRTGAHAGQRKREANAWRQGQDDLVRGDYVPGKKTLGLELVADPQLLANNEWNSDDTKTKKRLPQIRSRLGASWRDTPKISPAASSATEWPDADDNANARSASSARQRRLQQQQRNHAIERSKVNIDAGPKRANSGFHFSCTEDAKNKDNQHSSLASISATEDKSRPTSVPSAEAYSEPPSLEELVIEKVKVSQQQQPAEPIAQEMVGRLTSPALVRDRRAEMTVQHIQEQKQQRREQQELQRQFEEVLSASLGRSNDGNGCGFMSPRVISRGSPRTPNPKLPNPTVRDYFCTPTVSSSQIHDSSCPPVPVMASLGHSRLFIDKAATEASPKATVKRIASNDSPTSVVEFERLQGGEKSPAVPSSADSRNSDDTEKTTNTRNTSRDRKLLAETAKSNKGKESKEKQSENKLISKTKDFNLEVCSASFHRFVNSCWVPKECGSKEMEAISETRKKWKAAREAAAIAAAAEAQNEMGRMESEYSKPVDKYKPSKEPKPALFTATRDLSEKVSITASKAKGGVEATFDVGEGSECSHPPEIKRDLQPRQLFRGFRVEDIDLTIGDTIPAIVTSKLQPNKNPYTGDHNSVDDLSTLDNDSLNSTIGSSTMNTFTDVTVDNAPETTWWMPSLAIPTWQSGVNGMRDVFDKLDDAINGKIDDDDSDGSFTDESQSEISDFKKMLEKKYRHSRRKNSRRSKLLRDQRARRKKRLEKSSRHQLDSRAPLVSDPDSQRVSFSPDIDAEVEGGQLSG